MASINSEKFNLKWNDFESSISGSFRDIKEEKDFMDVTLACEENQLGAHRVVLAACSPKLKSILRDQSHHHPLLYLRGIKYSDLQSLITFMYHGEVNIAQEELDSFLAVAEELKIKGLTQSSSSTPAESQNKKAKISNTTRSVTTTPTITNTNRQSSSVSRCREEEEEEEIQEITAIKTEPTAGSLTQYEEQEEEAGEYDYQDQEMHYDNSQPDLNTSSAEYRQAKAAGVFHHEADRQILNEYIVKCIENGKTIFKCKMCDKANYRKHHIINHVESVHFPNLFNYSCYFCGKDYKTKNSLDVHVSTSHREEKHSSN